MISAGGLDAIMREMRQLITRIDEQLHAKLKARAASEGRSMNAVVTDLLSSGISESHDRAGVRARAEAAGLLITPPQPKSPPSRRTAISRTRGAGRAAAKALAAERARR